MAGYPYNQCEQLAEELKQRRMERFQELGPYPNAHVAFPGLDAGGGAPARAARPELPAEFHEDTSFPVPEGEKKIKKEKKQKESRKEEKKESARRRKRTRPASLLLRTTRLQLRRRRRRKRTSRGRATRST